MKEPSLLDVVKSVLTGPRVVRALFVLAGLYLAYRGLVALGLAQALPLALLAGGLLIVFGALMLRRPPEWAVPLLAARWPRVVPQPRPGAWPAMRSLLIVFYMGLGLALAMGAQVLWFKNAAEPFNGAVLWLVALLLWAPALWTWARPAVDVAPVAAVRPIHWRLGLVALAIGVLAYWSSAGHYYTPLVMATWIGSVVLGCVAILGLRVADLWAAWARVSAWLSDLWANGLRIRLSWTALGFIAILSLGTFLRFYELNDLPREMTSDHVEKLLDVNDVLNGQDTTFFPRNTGREPLQFYFVASIIRVLNLPLAHIALKVSTAIAGSLTLVFVFFLARELAGNEAGLLTLLLMAVARWPIAMSRAGLRYPFNPLFVAATFFFLVRGLKRGSRWDFVWAGLFMAIGLHGYTPFRVVPIAIAGIGLLWLARDFLAAKGRWQAIQSRVLDFGALFTVTLLGCLPLLRYMNDRPDMFWYRSLSRAGTIEQPIVGSAVSILLHNIYRVVLMFNLIGDQVWTVNISNWPALNTIMAALFGIGLIAFIVRALRGDRWAMLAVLAWFLALMPSALSLAFPNENPSVVRAGGSAPFVFLMAAWPLALMRREIVKRLPGFSGQILAAGALILLLGNAASTDIHDYYVTFRAQYAQSATNPSEVARQIKAFVAGGGDPSQVWLKGYPYWLDLRSVAIEAFGSFAWENAVMEPDQLTAMGSDPRPKLVIVHIWDRAGIAKLRELFPLGVLSYHTSATPGKDFLTYFVPGSEDFDENQLPPAP